MTFGQAVKSVLGQYAVFTGRARRAEYWWFALFTNLVQIPVQVIFFIAYFAAFLPALDQTNADGSIASGSAEDVNWGLLVGGAVPWVLVTFALIVPSIAVTVRRLHDTGRSGAWYLLAFVPGGSIVVLVFSLLEGDAYENAYGPDPKAAERYMGPGYGQPQQYGQPQPYAQQGQPQAYPPPPVQSFPPPPQGPLAQPPAQPDDPFAAPGR